MMLVDSPEVRCTTDELIIDGLAIRDRTVVDYYAAMPVDKRAGAAHDAMVVGSRALAAAGGSATMAALDDHLQNAVRGARETLTAMPDAIAGEMARICERYFTENGELDRRLGSRLDAVGSSLAADGPLLAGMCEKVSSEVRRRVADVLAPVSHALNVNDADGPLGFIARSVQDVQKQQAEVIALIRGSMKLREQRDVSVQKGYDLEDFVGEVLGRLCSQLSDRFEDCSVAAGVLGNCKQGDFAGFVDQRLTRGAAAGIVIEAKNRRGHTAVSLCRELEQAMANRDAVVGIGVLTNPGASSAPIALYGADKVIVHLPEFGEAQADASQQRQLLELAYYVARMQAVSLVTSAAADEFDSAFVSEHLERLEAALHKFRLIKRNLTAVETAIGHTRDNLEELETAFGAAAGDLRTRVERHTAALAGSRRGSVSP